MFFWLLGRWCWGEGWGLERLFCEGRGCWCGRWRLGFWFLFLGLLAWTVLTVYIWALTYGIHTQLFFKNPIESKRKFSIFIRTSVKFLIILFFIQLLLINILSNIKLYFPSLLHPFLTANYNRELRLKILIQTLTIFCLKDLVLVLNIILHDIEILRSKTASPLLSCTLPDYAIFYPTLMIRYDTSFP